MPRAVKEIVFQAGTRGADTRRPNRSPLLEGRPRKQAAVKRKKTVYTLHLSQILLFAVL